LITIGIIGSGNVAWHLALGFQSASGISVSWILGRNESTLKELNKVTGIRTVSKFTNETVDLIVICVNDDSVQTIINQLPQEAKVVYTSGTVSLDNLSFSQNNFGVFYPLQTFTKTKKIDLKDVPFLIESTNEIFTKELEKIAKLLSNDVRRINSEQRKHLHIAAVFSNNFVNHLFHLAQEHLKEKEIDKTILYPLIKETINKAIEVGPYDAQSGPARRNDIQTIDCQKQELNGLSKEIYTLITESILKTYSK
jgi:predicted short-subunit dehydrogenase-like oxidoreductase (DUF2520 family)